MTNLFERLSLQGRIRRLIDEKGREVALQIIHQAIEREIDREIATDSNNRTCADPVSL
jgi:hypothetical protein